MRPEDAEIFDTAMLDIMGALIALPTIRMLNSGDPEKIRPREPRHDRIPEIEPGLLRLEKLFERLQKGSDSASNEKLFSQARKDTQHMLTALPYLLPTISVKSSQASK